MYYTKRIQIVTRDVRNYITPEGRNRCVEPIKTYKTYKNLQKICSLCLLPASTSTALAFEAYTDSTGVLRLLATRGDA